MRLSTLACVAVAAGWLAGCAASVPIASQSDIPVAGAYGARVPGKWALYVDGDALPTSQGEEETFCPTFTWSMDVAPALRSTLARTFGDLGDAVVAVDRLPSAADLRVAGFAGVVAIRAQDFRLRIATEQQLSSTVAVVTADIGARLEISGRRGVLVEQSETASGRGVSDSGILCENNHAAIEIAVEQAMRALVSRLGADYMSAPELRGLAD